MKTEQIYHLGVKAIIQNTNGEVLILKRKGKGADGWDLPGGRVQQDENIRDTLIREVKEETGLVYLDNICPYGIFLTPIRIELGESQFARLLLYCHTCSIMDGQSVKLSSEHDSFLWTSWEKAKTLLSLDFTKIVSHGELDFREALSPAG